MIPFSPAYIKQEAIDEVIDTLKSGWITTGPKTKKFEKLLTEYCGNKNTLCVNSATFGLEMMLRWFDVGEGDEVIVPAYTYVASVNVIMHTGAKPVIVDVNANDFNINVEEIEKYITEKTKVIIPVDIAGLPADLPAINKLVKKHQNIFKPNGVNQTLLGRIMVLSDSAHSLGAEIGGNKTGSVTDVSVFSFHAVKNLTTAEGGAIALNFPKEFDNNKIYTELNTLSLHGQSKDALAKNIKGSWKYDVLHYGYKGNMTDIQSSLGIVALKYYESENLPKRRYIFEKYIAALSKYSWAELPVYIDSNRKTSFHLFTLRIKNITETQRDEIIQKIFDKEVSVNVHFQPIPMLSVYKNAGYKIEDYPVAYDNYSREITLPVYELLTDEQIETIINAVINSVKETIG